MSIIYKILGIPRTIDDFASKVKKKGINNAEVFIVGKISYSFDGIKYSGRVKLEADDVTFLLKKHCYYTKQVSTPDKHKNILYEEAKIAAKRLQELGLEAKVNSISEDIFIR